MDHVVRQVLIKVGQTMGGVKQGRKKGADSSLPVGISAQHLVLATKPVTGSQLAETQQVHHIECTDVVLALTKMSPPITTFPKPARDPTGPSARLLSEHHHTYLNELMPSRLSQKGV